MRLVVVPPGGGDGDHGEVVPIRFNHGLEHLLRPIVGAHAPMADLPGLFRLEQGLVQLLATDDGRLVDLHEVVGVHIVGAEIGEALVEQARPVIGQKLALRDGQRLARFMAIDGTQRRFGRDPDLAAVRREEGGEGALAALVKGVRAEIVEVYARGERHFE